MTFWLIWCHFFNRGSLDSKSKKLRKIRYFSEIFINIADAMVKYQNNHKNNVLLHHVMYADDFKDWKTFSEHYFHQILSGSKKSVCKK